MITAEYFKCILLYMFNKTHFDPTSNECNIKYVKILPQYFTRYLYDHMIDYNTIYVSNDIVMLELYFRVYNNV